MSHIFVGIQVPGVIGETLSTWANEYRNQIPLKQWTHQQDFHITLAFLGDSNQGNLTLLKESFTKIAETALGFKLQITGTGIFGNPKTPRVLWAGVEKEAGLFQLQKDIYSACKNAGYKLDERPYKPHITLGKKWGGSAPVNFKGIYSGETKLTWNVKDFVIFEINPKTTPKYQPVERFLLQ